MESRITIHNDEVIVHAGDRVIGIPATDLLVARMWDCSERREYRNRAFSIRRAYPLAGGLRLLLVNDAEGLVVPTVIKPAGDG